jgi:hypothetical protein
VQVGVKPGDQAKRFGRLRLGGKRRGSSTASGEGPPDFAQNDGLLAEGLGEDGRASLDTPPFAEGAKDGASDESDRGIFRV